MMRALHILPLLALGLATQESFAQAKLEGTPIGSLYSVDYATNRQSTKVNTFADAFDGNLDTFFASWDRSYTWARLDLGSQHVITKVGWSPRNDSQGPVRVRLGVFEGANSPDFMDALPLYIIGEQGIAGQMSYADTRCSRGFRYVRYVGPADARCNVAELEFYGYQGEGDGSLYYQLTNLPTVSIHTRNGEIPYDKEHEIVSQLTIISADGSSLLSEPGTIRERGNYSRSFDKKPYRIKFDEKQAVLDAPVKAKKWTLINNHGDKTLMRNLLAFELSRRLGMPYTPYGIAVDVLLNGEYKGCYQLCDQIQVHKGRVDIREMTREDISGSALTGGYLVEVDAYANQEKSWFNSDGGNPVTIKSPSEDSITSEQRRYIHDYFNQMEKDPHRYLDKNTFLRHFLVGELSGNTDTYWSTFMYKQRDDDMMYTGPVWDFDLAFDNDQRTYPVCQKSDFIYRTYGSCAGNMRRFVDAFVINSPESMSLMLKIWDQARRAGLTEESLVAYIDQMEAELQQSQRLNFLRWPIMNTRIHQNPHAWGSFKAEVENVRRFMKERLAWMDKRLGYSYDPSGITEAVVDMTLPYEVYSLSGQSCGSTLDGLHPGIYIIRQGQATRKVIVR